MGEAREIARGDAGYPARLLALARPPDRIFLEGPWNDDGLRVAIVGSRRADPDGNEFSHELAAQLARRRIAVISGLAEGIDAAAHRGALTVGGRTGAVLGTPLNRTFPSTHRRLQAACASSLGLITEHPPGSPVVRGMFASRNRIVAALADAVIVVQGRKGSGALITAADARSIGRPVGAVPWDPREPLAEAPLQLLRDGATLVRDVDDVTEMLGIGRDVPVADGASLPAPTPAGGRRATLVLPEPERRLYAALRFRAESLETTAERAGLSIAEASAALVGLELMGWARRQPGGLARRVRRRSLLDAAR